ncbi:MAG: hypothetical protein ACYDHU_02700 [Acidimicrobiales bacterium]
MARELDTIAAGQVVAARVAAPALGDAGPAATATAANKAAAAATVAWRAPRPPMFPNERARPLTWSPERSLALLCL